MKDPLLTHAGVPTTAGFVLAGGQSSRMGADKALALFHGVPLIQIAVESLVSAEISARIAGSRSALGSFTPVVPDTIRDRGPLAGVHAALAVSQADWNLFLPVDLPLMPASLLACLIQRAILSSSPITVPQLNGRLQPFPAVLHRSVLPILEDLLQNGESACHIAWRLIPARLGGALDAPAVENLVQCGQCAHPAGLPPALWFLSANTPADLAYLHHFPHLPSRRPISSNLFL